MRIQTRGLLVAMLGALQASCLREPPDRTAIVQGPLFLFVMAAPWLSSLLRSRHPRAPLLVLALQLLAYGVYETGVSYATDVRFDALLIIFAIGFHIKSIYRSSAAHAARERT
jgi:hypothetical protein